MDWLSQLHLLRPWWLLAALPALLLALLLWRSRGGDAGWRRAIDHDLLPHLLEADHAPRRQRHWLLLLTGWLLAVVALAGPSWERLPQPLLQRNDALVIVLDLSLSMTADDTKPSRLQRARFKIQDILAQRREGFTGLVAFAGSAHVVAPLTDDNATIANLVPALAPAMMPVPGSDPAAGVTQAIDLLRSAGQPNGRILLIGDDLRDNDVDRIAAQLDRRWELSLLGVGSEQGAPLPLPTGGFLKANGEIVVARLPVENFERLAQRSGGRFATLSADDRDLQLLLPDSPFDTNWRDNERQGLFDQWRDRGLQLTLLLLPLAALLFRRGWLLVLPLLLLPFSPRSEALEWHDLWRTPDQRAARELAEGDAAAAAERFRDPAWRGSALYRAGQYEAAAEAFAAGDGADADYNRGNALARAGRLKEALQAYDAALAQAPEMEDARVNRQLAEQLLQQQSQQSSEGDPSDQPEQEQGEGAEGEQQRDEASQEQGQPGGSGEQSSGQPEGDDPSQSQPQSPSDTDQQQDGEPESQPGDESEAQGEAEPEDDMAKAPPQSASSIAEQLEEERQQQRVEQWLRQIPDDPAGLMRRKFLYEQRQRERAGESRDGDQPLW